MGLVVSDYWIIDFVGLMLVVLGHMDIDNLAYIEDFIGMCIKNSKTSP